jgi:hypothetical protein
VTDLDKLAKSLTKAQRRVFLGEFNSPLSARSYGQIRGALIRKGIWAQIGSTPLGDSLRAHLKGQSDEG